MSEPAFIAFSDTHVDEHAWADRPEIGGDSQEAFRQVVRYAIKNKLPIVAAGDLLDRKRNDALPIGFMRRMMDELEEHHIPFYYIQGQHELQPDPWLSEIHRWPTWLHGNSIRLASGINAYGIDWQPREKVPEALAAVPAGTDVLIMHQVCHEFMGGITVAEMDFGQVPHASVLVVGDYHEHRTHDARGAQGQPLKVLSPGSTNMRKIDEPPAKKFFVVNHDLSFKSVRLRTRPYLDWEILNDASLDHFIEHIRSELKDQTAQAKLPDELGKPLIRVRYREDITNAYARIADAVGDWGHLFTKVLQASRDDEERIEGEETYEEVEELGLIGCLPLMVAEADEPEVFQLVHSLLATDDPQAALAAARAEYFADGQRDQTPDA